MQKKTSTLINRCFKNFFYLINLFLKKNPKLTINANIINTDVVVQVSGVSAEFKAISSIFHSSTFLDSSLVVAIIVSSFSISATNSAGVVNSCKSSLKITTVQLESFKDNIITI
jgi:hypothetical protein